MEKAFLCSWVVEVVSFSEVVPSGAVVVALVAVVVTVVEKHMAVLGKLQPALVYSL